MLSLSKSFYTHCVHACSHLNETVYIVPYTFMEVGHGKTSLHVRVFLWVHSLACGPPHPKKKQGRWIERTGRKKRKDWQRAGLPCPHITCCSHIPLKSPEGWQQKDETDKIIFSPVLLISVHIQWPVPFVQQCCYHYYSYYYYYYYHATGPLIQKVSFLSGTYTFYIMLCLFDTACPWLYRPLDRSHGLLRFGKMFLTPTSRQTIPSLFMLLLQPCSIGGY